MIRPNSFQRLRSLLIGVHCYTLTNVVRTGRMVTGVPVEPGGTRMFGLGLEYNVVRIGQVRWY